MKLLSINQDAKTVKGLKQGYLTGILYLAPLNNAGCGNVCPHASQGCAKACLYSAGRGAFSNVQQARINRTQLLFKDTQGFFNILVFEIQALINKAERQGLKPCIRLNGTSDIDFQNIYFDHCGKKFNIFEVFPNIQFYDYTKSKKRAACNTIPNYYLIYSRKETDQESDLSDLIKYNVAIVFDQVPKTYLGIKVINGDETDLRFLDPKGVIVGLTAKGKAKKDTTGFVVTTCKN